MDVYSINHVLLVGRIATDINFTMTKGDSPTPLAKFSIATNEIYKTKERKKENKVEYHKIVCWRRYAELVRDWASKGMLLAVVGKLRHRKYETDEGEKRVTTEVHVEHLVFLGKKGEFEQIEEEEEEEKKEEEPF